jgi:hypothetical protein
MSVTTAYAPFDASYPLSSPYLTTTEYLNAPTAVDTNNLIPGGNPGANLVALQETIGRASSLIDQWCLGAWGTLCATANTENGRVWGNRKGQLVVHPKYWPITEVRTFTYGVTAAVAASIVPAGNCWIEPTQFIIQPGGVIGLGLNGLAGIGPAQYQCTWTYVNGWPNTTFAASCTAGATSFVPADTTGIYPGTTLTVYDNPNDEQLVVAASYVAGAASVTLAAPTTFAHAVGAAVTNLPGAAKQAAISLVTVLVKIRGSGAMIASDIGEVTRVANNTQLPQGATDDLKMALSSVEALRQRYVGY